MRDFASAEVEKLAKVDGTITCAIPGHGHPGVESVSRSSVNERQLVWAYEGRCGFASDFDYYS